MIQAAFSMGSMSHIKKFFLKLKGAFAHKLPKGRQDFDVFADKIILTYDIPDMPSYRHAIASMIMHLGPLETKKPLKFFALSIQKAMANQVAYEVIQDIKEQEKQKEVTLVEGSPSEQPQ